MKRHACHKSQKENHKLLCLQLNRKKKYFKPSSIGVGSFLIGEISGAFCGDGIAGGFLGEGNESTVSIASDA